MPRSKEANEQIRQEQQARLLQAARQVFARKGMGATIDDIATEARVSHGLAYRYFPSKEAIVRALIQEAIADSPALGKVLDKPGTPGEQLRVLITEFVESRRRTPEFYQLVEQVLHDEAMPREFRALIQQRSRQMQETLRELIVAGQASGEVAKGDPDQLVSAILASLDGLTSWTARHPEQDDAHYPDAEIFLRMLKLSRRKSHESALKRPTARARR